MWKVADEKNIFVSWLVWHYIVAPREVLNKLKNIFSFGLDYFSIPFLIRTLFAPWRKYKFSYGRGFDAARFFEALAFNTFSRIMGMIMRCAVILVGVLTQLMVLFVGVLSIIFWIFLPIITALTLIISIQWLI